jgi:polysaccharide deacetylase family protein (PEP-CTERM system associated)
MARPAANDADAGDFVRIADTSTDVVCRDELKERRLPHERPPLGLGAATLRERGSASGWVNALSIDVEDYFQVSAFAPYVQRSSWDTMECRVERNVEQILTLLADCGARATFFTLGWIGERYPRLVRRIVEAGHELASHGFDHLRASEQGPDAFLADIRLAKAILEDVGGFEVRGYRAPSFSIGPSNRWSFDAIAEAGYRYSSSIYPIRHDHYGVPDAPRFVHEVRPGLLELPIATTRMLRFNLPAGGGGYFRLLPYGVSRWWIRRINARDRQPAVFYFHPWELDAEQPRVPGVGAKARFRHYLNLRRMAPRLARLLRDFHWDRVDRVFLNEGT